MASARGGHGGREREGGERSERLGSSAILSGEGAMRTSSVERGAWSVTAEPQAETLAAKERRDRRGFWPSSLRSLAAKSLSENCVRSCDERFWLWPRWRDRSIPASGCKGRANAGQSQKIRRPEGFRGKGCLASFLLSRRSARDILLRRAIQPFPRKQDPT